MGTSNKDGWAEYFRLFSGARRSLACHPSIPRSLVRVPRLALASPETVANKTGIKLMKPRPLCRQKSFWFGVLVIAFLGWAWADSLSTAREAYFYRQGFFCWHGDSRAVFHISAAPGWMPSDESGIGFHSYILKSSRRLSLPAVSITEWVEARTTVEVPHWFVILLFLLPWSGWLGWRWRRMKRLSVQVNS